MQSTLLIWLAALLVGGTAAALTIAFWPRRLLAEAAQLQHEETPGRMAVFGKAIFARLAKLTQWLLSEAREAQLRQRLLMMGETKLRPMHVVVSQVLCGVGFAAFAVLMVLQTGFSVIWIVLGGGFGWILPLLWMQVHIQNRHQAIGRTMPFNLDLLTLSVEAGMDFAGAVNTVVARGLPGPFTEELGIMLREIRMGKSREQALKNLAHRARYAPLTQFVSNLVQAERMGSSLGKVLRIQASQLRVARTQKAEKLANEAPVKMLFPLIFCIFPTVFMILFGPIVYQFVQGGQ